MSLAHLILPSAFTVVLLSAPAAQSARVSHPFRNLLFPQDVSQFSLQPEGDEVLYVADVGNGFLNHLVSVEGGESRGVPGPADVKLAPSSGLCVYTMYVDHGSWGYETILYSAPIDLSSAPIVIDSLFYVDYLRTEISPGGTRVAYWDTDGKLYSAPLDGSQPPLTLYDGQFGAFFSDFVFSPDSSRVVALVNDDLVSFSADGSQPQVGISANVETFTILADTTVVFLAWEDSKLKLFSRPLDVSSPRRLLSGGLVAGSNVVSFRMAPDGSAVAFCANKLGQRSLFATPMDGSTTPVLLSGAPPASANVQLDFQFDASSQRVLYRSDVEVDEYFALYSVPASGGAAPVKLSPTLVAGGSVSSFVLPPVGPYVAYRADQEVDERFELYTVPIDGSRAARPLSGSVASWADVQDDYCIGPSGVFVFFRLDQAVDETFQLFGHALNGAGQTHELNGPLPPGGDVLTGFLPVVGGRVVYRADEAADEVIELFSASLKSPRIRLNLPLRPESRKVTGFAMSQREGRAVYRAEHARKGHFELFSVALDDPRDFARLNPPLGENEDVDSFLVTKDERHAIFSTTGLADQKLFSVRIDGVSPPIRLNPPPRGGQVPIEFVTSADGLRVLYRTPQDYPSREELYSVPIDGHAPAVRLNGPLSTNEDVQVFRASSSGRVVFMVSSSGVNTEMWSVPDDGSAPAVQLTGPSLAGTTHLRLSPDGSRVVFRANQSGKGELYSALMDGSAPAVRLSGPPTSIGGVDEPYAAPAFEISPDSTRVVYLSDQDQQYVTELHSAPIDGSSPPVMLVDFPPQTSADVDLFRISPDSTRVVYRADADFPGRYEIYRVGIDGTLPVVKLNPPLVTNGNVSYPLLTDSGLVLYSADQLVDDQFELFSVPIDGGLAVRLNAALPSSSDDAGNPVLNSSGDLVAFTAPTPAGEDGLYVVPTAGNASAQLVGEPLGYNSAFWGFAFSPDSRRLLYLANQSHTIELFQGFPQRPLVRKPTPP